MFRDQDFSAAGPSAIFFFSHVTFHFPWEYTHLILIRVCAYSHWPHASVGCQPDLSHLKIRFEQSRSCDVSSSSICSHPCHNVTPAEEQNRTVWLMLQPHPLDQRYNYIVISFTGPIKLLWSTVLWLPFIKHQFPLPVIDLMHVDFLNPTCLNWWLVTTKGAMMCVFYECKEQHIT